MIGRIRNLRPRLSGNGQVADEAIAQADRVLAFAEDMADASLSTSGQLAEARQRWQAAEADQAEGHARIVELQTERDGLARAYTEMAQGVRDELRASGCLPTPVGDVVLAVRRLAAEYRYANQDRQALELRRTAPSSISAQDRRNAVVLCDALALAEGRKQGVGYARPADPELVGRLLDAVRVTVSQVLDLDLECVR